MRGCYWIVAIGFALWTTPLNAQQVWSTPGVRQAIGIEVTRGFFPQDDEFVPSSYSAVAGGRIALSPVTSISVSVPYSRLAFTVRGGDFGPPRDTTVTSTAFGNPSLGIQTQLSPGSGVDFVITPGVSRSSDENTLGFAAVDDFDRFESWLPHVTSLRAQAHLGRIPTEGGFVEALLGGTYSSGNNATEWFANYGVRAGYRGRDLIATLALTGRMRLSGDGSIDDRTVHQLEAALEGGHGALRPRAAVRTYLDSSVRKNINAIVTAGLQVVF